MYISHQGQQVIHQEMVNDGMRRSEQRRLLKELETESGTDARSRAWNLTATLTALVRSMRGAVARP